MDESVSYLNKLNLANVIHSNKNTRCSWFPEHAVQLSGGTQGQIHLYTNKTPLHVCWSTTKQREVFDPGVWFPTDQRANSDLNNGKQPWLHARRLWCGKDVKLQHWQELLPGLSGMQEGEECCHTHNSYGGVLAPCGKTKWIPVRDTPWQQQEAPKEPQSVGLLCSQIPEHAFLDLSFCSVLCSNVVPASRDSLKGSVG